MFFDTPIYFVFLTVVLLLYWPLRRSQQNVLLLTASYFFYGWWDWRFLGLIAISTLVDYCCAHFIDRSFDIKRRRTLLTISLSINLGFLGFFKYFNFFEDSFVELLQQLGVHNVNRTYLAIVLPPGISFYTFQEVAYIIDVYKRQLKPAKSLVDYALFVSVFPHLIAGPIQRPSHLLPQVQGARHFDGGKFFDGLMLITCGLFRKCVIADNCALLANAAFEGRLGPPSLAVLAIGSYAFAWQIYGDFSGYSDIARGSAQLLGFHFMVNFRQPYLATSLRDFWRRWHISLSTWLRDYLYIPLGGNRLGEFKTYRNLLITMVLGGLWHGANWTFVIWGAIHGIWLSLERFGATLFQGIADNGHTFEVGTVHHLLSARKWLARIVVFHIVCLAWIFFRADSVTAAWNMISLDTPLYWRREITTAFTMLACFAVPLLALDVINEIRHEEYLGEKAPELVRLLVAFLLFAIIALFSGNNLSAFIYFQF